MNGEVILRELVLVLFIPALGAVVAYATGHPSTAMALNGAVPLLVFAASALAIVFGPPTQFTVGGALYFVVLLVVLGACAIGFNRRSLHPALFWCTWTVNLAIVAFLVYLFFLFKIF